MHFIEVTLKDTKTKVMVNLSNVSAIAELPKMPNACVRLIDLDAPFEVTETYDSLKQIVRDITDAKVTHDFTQQQGTVPGYTWKPEHD